MLEERTDISVRWNYRGSSTMPWQAEQEKHDWWDNEYLSEAARRSTVVFGFVASRGSS